MLSCRKQWASCRTKGWVHSMGSGHLCWQCLFRQWLRTNSWGAAPEPDFLEFVPWDLLSQASSCKALLAVDFGLRISFGIWQYRSSKESFTLDWCLYKSPWPLCLPPPSSLGRGSLQRVEFRELQTWSFLVQIKQGKVDAGTSIDHAWSSSVPLAKSLRKMRNRPGKRMVLEYL